MKRQLTTFLLLMLGVIGFSQTFLVMVKPKDSKFWGYADEKGSIVIDAKYQKLGAFSKDGVAPVVNVKSKLAEIIDTKGSVVKSLPKGYKYKNMKSFKDGMKVVSSKGKFGFVDVKGAEAINCQYSAATPFNEGYALVRKENEAYVLTKDAKEILISGVKINAIHKFKGGLGRFRNAENSLFGFVNTSGKVVIDAKFKSAGNFNGGVAWAKDNNGKVGFIDENGAWIIEPKFEAGKKYDPITGLARVKLDGKWMYVRKDGSFLNVEGLEKWGDFENGLCDGKLKGKIGFFDKDGKWVIKSEYDATRGFKNGYAAVKLNGLWGFIDTSGKVVIQPTFLTVKDLVPTK